MKLKIIQESIQQALAAVDALDAVAIVAEDLGDVLRSLQENIAQQKCAILVKTPAFKATSKASKIMVGTATVEIVCIERVVENRSSTDAVTAQDMAEIVAWHLNMLLLADVGTLVFTQLDSAMLDDHTLAYNVAFEVQTTLANPLDN